jgi:hypothetical protein
MVTFVVDIRLAQAMQGSCQQGARSALEEIGP